MVETMCDSGAVKLKAGANAAVLTGAQYTQLINQAEATVNIVTRNDYTASFSTLSGARKLILEEMTSNQAAIYVIENDMSGFTSRGEAEDMISVLRDGLLRGISLIKDQKAVTFINGT